eukprot:scaffold204671_cov18-Tisochrysis_lutea.AAC.1
MNQGLQGRTEQSAQLESAHRKVDTAFSLARTRPPAQLESAHRKVDTETETSVRERKAHTADSSFLGITEGRRASSQTGTEHPAQLQGAHRMVDTAGQHGAPPSPNACPFLSTLLMWLALVSDNKANLTDHSLVTGWPPAIPQTACLRHGTPPTFAQSLRGW